VAKKKRKTLHAAAAHLRRAIALALGVVHVVIVPAHRLKVLDGHNVFLQT
jgi:hypothetical protein